MEVQFLVFFLTLGEVVPNLRIKKEHITKQTRTFFKLRIF